MGDFFSKSKPQTETKQTNTTTNTAIPAWLENAARGNIEAAGALPGTVPYSGVGVAGLSPAQLQAIGLATGQPDRFAPQFNSAFGGATNAMNFSTPALSAGGVAADIPGLMNPFTSGVADVSSAEINRQRQIRQMENDARAGRFHALGSDNNEIVNTENNRNFDTIDATTRANLLKGGYDDALRTALAIGQGNQSAALTGAGINLSGASTLGNLANTASGAGWNDITGLLGAGGVQQGNDQAREAFNYNEFLRQLQSPYSRLQAMSQAAATAPHGTTSTGTGNENTTKEIFSSPFGQIAGLGLGLAGLGMNPLGAAGSLGFGLLSKGFMGPGSFSPSTG